MNAQHAMPFGAALVPGGGVRFALWAPGVDELALELAMADAGDDGPWALHAMAAQGDGWWALTLAEAKAGDAYRFVLPDGLRVPDPASRRNARDVHGPSTVVDPLAYRWRDDDWRGRPWHEAVVYELHVGAFTPEGSFAAAQQRLAELARLGITAIEIMPVADFPGRRGWGYDGVLPFAPDASYGTPDDFKALVDAAHQHGLMVLLDVVYNHFGPEGNYLHAYCGSFFNPAHHTPWGAAINFDGEGAHNVRSFFVHNALYWLEEFHLDGLRMDAIHAMADDSPTHIVAEICAAISAGPGRERAIHVVLENEHNQARWLARDAAGRPLRATAQWNDDLHHALHVLATGETAGYYIDYASKPLQAFGRALAQGFVYTGQPSLYLEGAPRGEPCAHLPLAAFVSHLQTHDQIGNRAFGERIDALAPAALLRAARACLLLSPHVPMLFMGEEYAARTPFLFFCDVGPELAAAVSAGRRAEFSRFPQFSDLAVRERIPDPNAASTFEASKLDWAQRQDPGYRQALASVRDLLAVRRRELVPRLAGQRGAGSWQVSGDVLYLQWTLGAQAGAPAPMLQLVANFGAGDAHVAAPPGRCIHIEGAPVTRGEGTRLTLPRGGVWAAIDEVSGDL